MCGIAGVVAWNEAPTRERLEAMGRSLKHRGPDDEGYFLDGPCGLAFRRLAIIDLVTGHQPMTVEHATAVLNGELYNFREVRNLLVARGRTFRTTSDTEVLVQAYLEWGDDCVERLDGMFAFALWDAQKRRLWGARDRWGKKPFYWTQVGQTFLFASELKALLQHPRCPRTLDVAALRQYLACDYVPTPHSIFEGVHKLREAHSIAVDERGVTTRRYYHLPAPSAPTPTVEEAEHVLRESLGRAVRRRLVSDVPLGLLLSGGIDSSAIAAFAVREVPSLKTFCLAFEEADFDESAHGRRAAKYYGTDHSEETLSVGRCLDLVPQAAEQLDEPFADPSYFPTFLVCKLARQRVTVVLGGDGADELFAGYDTFVAHAWGQRFARLPGVLQRAIAAGAEHLPARSGYMSFDFRLRKFLQGAQLPAAHRHQAWIGSLTPSQIERLVAPDYRPAGSMAEDVYAGIDALAGRGGGDSLDFALRFYRELYLRDDILAKVDRASMASSLEVRAPFLDTALVEWVVGLPPSFKLRGTRRKWLLKRALRGMVPPDILHRRKHGFALPVAAWLQGPLRPLLEELLEPGALAREGIFDAAEVARLKKEHLEGQRDHRKPLWSLAMFELWRRRWA